MLIIAVSFAAAAKVQIIVKFRPVAPAYRVRPIAPSRAHVWMGGNYVWPGVQYICTMVIGQHQGRAIIE